LEYDSPANDYVAGTRVRWHFTPVTETAWRRRELGADLFTRRAALEREALRVITGMLSEETGRAIRLGQWLSLALINGRMARALRGAPTLQVRASFVFVPEDSALGDEVIAGLPALALSAGGRLERIIREHVAIAPDIVDPEDLSGLETVSLRFLCGASRELRRSKRGLTVGEIVVSKVERLSPMLIVCYIRGTLSAELRPATNSSTARETVAPPAGSTNSEFARWT
jgi:hypothetical protein